MSWERRRAGELTTEYLGRVLDEHCGLPEMAKRARRGHFDDFFCPPEVDDGMNIHRLVGELQGEAMKAAERGRKRQGDRITPFRVGRAYTIT
jgi:hypothetical protein